MAARRQRLTTAAARLTEPSSAQPGRRSGRPRGTRLALLVAVVCMPGMLMLANRDEASADPSAAGPVSSSSYSPALAFVDTEHSALPLSRRFGSAERPGFGAFNVPTNQFEYFSELEMTQRSGSELELAFKVEGQPDSSQYRFCRRGVSACQDVEVRVISGPALSFAAGKGLLYFWNSGSAGGSHWPAAYPQQRLEVSAWDTDSGLKVYREVLVNPPPEGQGCEEDYGDDTVEAYVCLYLREMIPEGVGGSDEATLRTDLPGLVQDKSSYSLVFVEEFDGTPPAANPAGCRDGLSTLEESVWNYGDPCRNLDSRGGSCNNISGGSLHIGVAYNCGANVNTFGKLHYKYGYLEFKYTVTADFWRGDHNLNLVAWAPLNSRQHLWNKYGMAVDNWEDFLRYGDVELDFLEYIPPSRHESWIQHANWGQPVSTQLPQFRSRKQFYYCGGTRNPRFLFLVNPNTCRRSSSHTFTVTKGVEWTPRGYRTFIRWDGVQDDLTLWPEEYIDISGSMSGNQAVVPEAERSRYFEYLKPGDTSTLLEQVAIGHTPNPISIGSFGITNTGRHYIRTTLSLDYIRLWQPQNHYSDMEPVYQ